MRAAGAFPFADVVERDLMEVLAEGGGVFAGDSSLASAGGFYEQHRLGEKPIIALLPGSRKQEIERVLPVMLSVIPDFDGVQFVVAGVSAVGEGFYDRFCIIKSF